MIFYCIGAPPISSAPRSPFSLRQSDAPLKRLQEELLSVISLGDDVQAVSSLLCKGAPIERLGGRSALRLAVTSDRHRIVSLLLASGSSLSSTLLMEAWKSPNVTHRVLAHLTTVSTMPCLSSCTVTLQRRGRALSLDPKAQQRLLCSAASV